MGWERRERGGTYYTRSRREGGRVVRQYIGAGEVAGAIAWFDAHDRDEAELARWHARTKEQERLKLEACVMTFCLSAEAVAAQAMEAAGYHRHQRGKWRKRRMTTAVTQSQDKQNQATQSVLIPGMESDIQIKSSNQTQHKTQTQQQKDEELIERAQKVERAQKGRKVPRAEIRWALDRMKNPPVSNLPHLAGLLIAQQLAPDSVVAQECMRRDIEAVSRQAAGPHPSPLESLLADAVGLSWAYLQYAEATQNGLVGSGAPMDRVLLHCRRTESAQKRYLSAIKTLAQVRRYAIPVIQVNVGDQQLNIGEKQLNLAG
jgi:hypothetical protein